MGVPGDRSQHSVEQAGWVRGAATMKLRGIQRLQASPLTMPAQTRTNLEVAARRSIVRRRNLYTARICSTAVGRQAGFLAFAWQPGKARCRVAHLRIVRGDLA